ncbi:MAG: GAF domain-containing sensor histidine kinase [Xenococcaceae cyanobacterium]
MIKPSNGLFCRLDGLTTSARKQQRFNVLSKLGLLEAETIPVFDEATQTAANFLEVPICILGVVAEEELWFRSTVGLSRIGLMNQLATERKLSLEESFSTYVIDSQQTLVIENAIASPVFANTALVQHFGIRTYLGVPLVTSEGHCIGTLEVMDLVSRQFSEKDLDFLALTARWCLREFERDYLLKNRSNLVVEDSLSDFSGLGRGEAFWAIEPPVTRPVSSKSLTTASAIELNSTNAIKVRLLGQLTQELRTPLTSVIGMASVLRREVYGPLTVKQKEYLEIIHNSGQNLISLVDEIVNLGVLEQNDSCLHLSSIDIEMLCQQVINSLIENARQQQQELRLSVEPGNRIWSLDKEKVKQALYYLINSVLELSEAGGEVRVHVSRKQHSLNIAVWLSHPWLGDGLPQLELYAQSVTRALALHGTKTSELNSSAMGDAFLGDRVLTSSALMSVVEGVDGLPQKPTERISREILGLLLSCHLIELHGGQIVVQGMPESGYRYILKLPNREIDEFY